jgi:hypothetical protein
MIGNKILMNEDVKKSVSQNISEEQYVLTIKKTLDEDLVELSKVRVRPWNIFKIIRLIRKIMNIFGTTQSTMLVNHLELRRIDLDLCSMIESLQRQIISLEERIRKLER